MFYNNLVKLKNDMSKYHRDRDFLVTYYINNRLNDSLKSYYSDLEMSMKYLYNRKPENVVKQL